MARNTDKIVKYGALGLGTYLTYGLALQGSLEPYIPGARKFALEIAKVFVKTPGTLTGQLPGNGGSTGSGGGSGTGGSGSGSGGGSGSGSGGSNGANNGTVLLNIPPPSSARNYTNDVASELAARYYSAQFGVSLDVARGAIQEAENAAWKTSAIGMAQAGQLDSFL